MVTDLLEIRLLGDFQARIGERTISDDGWPLRKAAGIIKLLALQPDYRLHREQILDALWPDLDPDAASNNLRGALLHARRTLDTGGLPRREGSQIVLGDPEEVWVDVKAFEEAVDLAWRGSDRAAYQTAARLYTGELLPGDLYEEWADSRRTALRTSWLALLTRLAEVHEASDDLAESIETWQQIAAAEPTREEAHTRLMLLYTRTGRRDQALARFDQLTAILSDELGAEPDLVTRQLAEAIRSGQIASEPVSRDTAPTGGSSLPTPVTALIGRDREVAEVRQALVGSRLVTVTGPGGTGKTRLSLDVAAAELTSFNGGVFFVPLASVASYDLVAAAAIQTLGLPDPGNLSPAETLSSYLRGRVSLVVFDNFEHVIEAAPLVSSLLAECPDLTVLTTSRTPLRVRGEREFPLRPLPDEESSQLFIARAREVRPGFDPDSDEMETVRQICQRLDGLPLAIELAAARTRVLSAQALLDRLERPLALLTSGPRDLPARQRTLRATIAWSYDLLEPDVQTLFRALAVFANGWSVDAAAVVCPVTLDPLEGISALVECSLVEQFQSGDEPRFRMLETIREFGLEMLSAEGMVEDFSRLHAEYYLEMAERFGLETRNKASDSRLVEMASHQDNYRLALSWMLQHDPNRTLRVLTVMDKYMLASGSFREWDQFLTAALDRSHDPPVEDRARALSQLGFTRCQLADLSEARRVTDEALDLGWEFNLVEILARSTNVLAFIEVEQGNYERALEYAEEALNHYRDFGEPVPIAAQLGNVAYVRSRKGDREGALEILNEALSLHQTTGDVYFIVANLSDIGQILHYEGRLPEARERLDEALALARRFGAINVITNVVLARIAVAIDEGQFEVAREMLVDALISLRASRDEDSLIYALDEAGIILANTGRPSHGARLLAAAETHHQASGVTRSANYQEWLDGQIKRCRYRLDDTAWDVARIEGSGIPLNQAVAIALDELEDEHRTT